MPGGYNTMALYLNTKIFADAGVEPPTDTWTWDEFRAAGQAIKTKTGAFLTAAGTGYFTDVMPWMLNNGAAPISEDWTTSTINTPAAVEALTFARSLVVDGLAPKPGGTVRRADADGQGQARDLRRWPAGPPTTCRRLKFVEPVVLVKWPQQAKPGSPVGWDAWPILKQSKNKDSAWIFITYLISETFGDAITAGGGGAVPARISGRHRPGVPEGRTEEHRAARRPAGRGDTDPGPDRGAETQKVIEEAWTQGVSGTKDPQTALAEADAKLQALLS